MGMYDVEIQETYKCIATICAKSEEEAIEICKRLYDEGVLELDSEDITVTRYSIIK